MQIALILFTQVPPTIGSVGGVSGVGSGEVSGETSGVETGLSVPPGSVISGSGFDVGSGFGAT